jgi:dephospho-CoA kinase
MLKIGLTGNIGSGKSTISKVFKLLGIPVFDSDTEAKRVMTLDQELIAGVKSTFGNNAYLPTGELDRRYIANIVFNDPDQLLQLNALVHPAVFRAFDQWLVKYQGLPYIIKEAAILFESGSYKDCDRTIVVTAPASMRLARVTKRDHITHDEAEQREARQMPQEQKQRLADHEIRNDNTVLVIPQVLQLHQHFLTLAQTGA